MLIDNAISGEGGKLYSFGIRHKNASGLRWLHIVGAIPSNVSGYRMPQARTISTITLQTNSVTSGTISIYKNGTTLVTSISVSSEAYKTMTGLTLNLVAGDVLSARIEIGQFDYPSLTIETL